jgi:hypothetical protein
MDIPAMERIFRFCVWISVGRKRTRAEAISDTASRPRSFASGQPVRRGRDTRRGKGRGPTRVLVVESHPIFRDGLMQCLNAAPDFRVIGCWESGHIDVASLRAWSPNLVLMNVELPGQSGIEATRNVQGGASRAHASSC